MPNTPATHATPETAAKYRAKEAAHRAFAARHTADAQSRATAKGRETSAEKARKANAEADAWARLAARYEDAR